MMKRRWTAGFLALALILALCACGVVEHSEPGGQDSSQEPSGETAYPDMVLTKEQMLSDYDAMWEAVRENYPFFGVLARSHPENPRFYEKVIDDYRGQLEGMTLTGDESMFQFLNIVASSLYDVCGTVGHVSIVNPNYYRGLDVYRKYLDEMPEVQPWVDVIDRPQVADFYSYYDYLITSLLEKEAGQAAEEGELEEASEESAPARENLAIEVLEEGKTAYIRVDSFDDALLEGDLPKIRAFLEEVRDYGHLIIDIRENGGGNTVYWEEAFVRLNITEPVTSRLVRLMKDAPLARRFYGADYGKSALRAEEVKADPKFTRLPREDMPELTLAREIPDTIQPASGEKLFPGRIWVLVGPGVYSSAEAFAVFCKDTGFATLVGQTTGGSDSGGPILYELPASHLLIQFDVEYCLNADGSCNQETGTTPDVEAQDALQAALELIDG